MEKASRDSWCEGKDLMNYSVIKKTDVADGPGVRVALFVSGCRHHCKGCFNAETWSFSYGRPYTEETAKEILEALAPDYIRGITLLGGEPFEPENRPQLIALLQEVREKLPKKDVWCYSGYTLDKDMTLWIQQGKEDVKQLLSLLDVLVDGEFVEARKDLKLKFRGSDNQRIIDVPASMEEGRVILKEHW